MASIVSDAPSRGQRTVIVGDVHGCAIELDALLHKVAFSSGDRLVFVGDLVARGPDTLGVLDIARRTGAIVVRGNHEQNLLTPHDPANKFHLALSASLRPVDWTLIRTSPLFVDLPEHDVRVIHAGIDPRVAFERQSPDTMMRIRTVIDALGKRGKRQVLWGERYEGPTHIVFGHHAAQGLQLHPWATGLDTGCVYGGRLTSLVLAAGQKVPQTVEARKRLLVSVPARKVWFAPTKSPRVA